MANKTIGLAFISSKVYHKPENMQALPRGLERHQGKRQDVMVGSDIICANI
jgi:predicted house-cleaning NTP pyrophosphatase (Maf/HAM1 superfamily)